MDVNVIRVAVTVLSFLCFLGVWWWAWRGANQSRFDELARICVGLENDRSLDVQCARNSDESLSREAS